MTTLTYQAQLQEQQQEGGAPAPGAISGDPADGPVPDGFGDDAIINDLLGGAKDRRAKDRERPERERPRDEPEPREVQEEEEPEEPTPDDDEAEPAATDDEDEELPAAAEADEPLEGSLEEARAAREAGDIDKACMLAFGCKPEELAPSSFDWTKWRKANDREAARRSEDRRAIDAQHHTNEQWVREQRLSIHNTIEQLRPYEEVRQGLAAFDQHGDPEPLVRLIEKATRMSWADFNKAALTKTRRSPQERLMAERLQQLEGKLQEREREREQQTQQQTQQQTYQADLAHIRGAVKGDVSKIPKFAERIYTILDKTRNHLGLTKTIEQAAAMVLRSERRRIEAHPLVRKAAKTGKGGRVPPPVSNAARTLAARSAANKNRPPLRRDSQNNGAPNREAETDDDIIGDILAKRPAIRGQRGSA
jgi:hypothetical protein